jgi:thiol:disulfide interchange protein
MGEGLEHVLAQTPLLAYPVVYAAGLLTSFTPCVYPMIPITVGFIGGMSAGSRLRGFLLSVSYVIGLAITYSILGAMAALTGSFFGQVATDPWVNLVVGVFILVLGLAMVGAWEIRLPSFLLPKAGGGAAKGWVGALLVGATSGFVAAPCTAPALGAVLAYVATRRSIVFGTSLLFTFALGMGTLLVIIGTFAGLVRNLPRAGAWMTRVRKAFGWLMVAVGVYFVFHAGQLRG